ncbi:MAG: DNA repair protein RecN [Proteobacteria bacterium]|nr:DNA repair protein RecN [Pseudomonadota bacterium]
MIVVLRIQNLAVVEDLEIEFGPGLNVITGETGAGKSILVKSLELLRGSRATPHLVRTGAKSASVEALIDRDGEQFVVRRTVSAKGGSRAYIDGEMCTVQVLQQRAKAWLDISGQHEHHALVDANSHLVWLDRFAQVQPLRSSVASSVAEARQALARRQAFEASVRDRDDQMDLLRFQLAELDRVDAKVGELDTVLSELETLTHAAGLQESTERAAHLLNGDRHCAAIGLTQAHEAITRAARIDTSLEPLAQRIDSSRIEIEDIAGDLGLYASRLASDPGRLARVREREKQLSRLARRHGSIEAALTRRGELHEELDQLDRAEDDLARAREESLKLRDLAVARATELSNARQRHADRLAEAVSSELAALGMGHARIEVNVATVPARPGELQVDGARLGAQGFDRAEFLIAPNPGETPRPLTKVASGGELSRALLALKQVLAGLGPVGSYVFDEVDTGVGGAVAEAIGRKLHTVAQHHQVLCITHQAVIAAWGDHHLRVEKRVSDGRTRTQLTELNPTQRRDELARMLGGAQITAGVRQAAGDLLRQAKKPSHLRSIA